MGPAGNSVHPPRGPVLSGVTPTLSPHLSQILSSALVNSWVSPPSYGQDKMYHPIVCVKHCDMFSWGASDANDGMGGFSLAKAACIKGSTGIFVHSNG